MVKAAWILSVYFFGNALGTGSRKDKVSSEARIANPAVIWNKGGKPQRSAIRTMIHRLCQR